LKKEECSRSITADKTERKNNKLQTKGNDYDYCLFHQKNEYLLPNPNNHSRHKHGLKNADSE
jgi:hypothetical protein